MNTILIGDTKPLNYNYLSFNIISSVTHEGKIELLKTLEQMLLKSIIIKPPKETSCLLKFIKIFDGKDANRVISVWFMELAGNKKLGSKIAKLNKMRFN